MPEGWQEFEDVAACDGCRDAAGRFACARHPRSLRVQDGICLDASDLAVDQAFRAARLERWLGLQLQAGLSLRRPARQDLGGIGWGLQVRVLDATRESDYDANRVSIKLQIAPGLAYAVGDADSGTFDTRDTIPFRTGRMCEVVVPRPLSVIVDYRMPQTSQPGKAPVLELRLVTHVRPDDRELIDTVVRRDEKVPVRTVHGFKLIACAEEATQSPDGILIARLSAPGVVAGERINDWMVNDLIRIDLGQVRWLAHTPVSALIAPSPTLTDETEARIRDEDLGEALKSLAELTAHGTLNASGQDEIGLQLLQQTLDRYFSQPQARQADFRMIAETMARLFYLGGHYGDHSARRALRAMHAARLQTLKQADDMGLGSADLVDTLRDPYPSIQPFLQSQQDKLLLAEAVRQFAIQISNLAEY